MQKPWTPQIKITEQLVTSLVNQQFPELPIDSLKFFGSGWDNTLYLINKEYVFRFPHREEALKWLVTEANTLPCLAVYLSVPIPTPLFIGKPTVKYPYIFYGYKLLSGKSIGNFKLSIQAYKKLAIDLSLFLKSLHTVSLDLGLMPEPTKVDFEHCIVRVLEDFDLVISHNLLPAHFDRNTIKAFIKSWALLQVPKEQVVLHGDLYARHVLINEDGNIIGVIDWGDLHSGCAGIDIGIVYWMLPLEFHNTFFKGYGELSFDILKIAQFRAFYVAIRLLVYGYEIHDQLIIRESLFCIENVLTALEEEIRYEK